MNFQSMIHPLLALLMAPLLLGVINRHFIPERTVILNVQKK